MPCSPEKGAANWAAFNAKAADIVRGPSPFRPLPLASGSGD